MTIHVYDVLDTIRRIKRVRAALDDPNVTVDRTGLEEEIVDLLTEFENVLGEFKVVVG